MAPKQTTVTLWVICSVLLIVMIATILLVTPTPFAALIERSAQVDSSAPPVVEDNTFDINHATAEQWYTLEGMDRDIYMAITDRLERYGDFQSVDELLEVDGVTEELLAVWCDRLWCS